ncbi:transmembrane protein 256 homolog [Oppia nitens]|uniref:transmembrane protein 256 homolog n=1 Tax=Oppia nitens TaxID=1686743 RepID=UPI0023DAD2BF|nr:transmembrane protein 256 homolog [Oppia nitens]
MDKLNQLNGVIKDTTCDVLKSLTSLWQKTPPVDPMVTKLVTTARVVKLSEIATRREVLELLQTSHWTRIAAIFGATAVAMGAYGAHGLDPKPDVPIEYKHVFETANKYHFFHSLALLAVPLTRRPLVVGTLMTAGMCVFCGTCYVYSLTHNKDIIKYTPYGGLTLILAWLSMLL